MDWESQEGVHIQNGAPGPRDGAPPVVFRRIGGDMSETDSRNAAVGGDALRVNVRSSFNIYVYIIYNVI